MTQWSMKLVYGYQRWGGTTPVPTNSDIDRWQQKQDAAILKGAQKKYGKEILFNRSLKI